MRLYAFSIFTQKQVLLSISSVHMCGYTMATSKAEAVGHALELAKSKYPNSEGWQGHIVDILLIDAHVIGMAYGEIMKQDG